MQRLFLFHEPLLPVVTVPTVTVFSLLFLVPRAYAGNEDELLMGNRAALMGGAVIASVDDGSAIYYNPAGLEKITANRVDVSASAYTMRFYSMPNLISTEERMREDAAITEFVAVPTLIAYALSIEKNVSLGFGYFVPRSTELVLRENLMTPITDGRSNWSLDVRVSATQHLFSAGIGLQPLRGLRIGIAPFLSYYADTDSAALFGNVIRVQRTERLLQVDTLVNRTAIGLELVSGLQIDIVDNLTLGITIRSPRLLVWNEFEESFNSSIASQQQSGEPALFASTDRLDDSDAPGYLVLLGRYYLGIAYTVANSTLTVEADLQPGIHNKKANIDRLMTINARMGIFHILNEDIAIGFGVFTTLPVDFAARSWSIDRYSNGGNG